eukprot:jgi/Ulvmu1/12673/UM094_0029.1
MGTLTSPSGAELATPALVLNTRFGHCPKSDNSSIDLWSAAYGQLAVAISSLQIHCGKTSMSTIANVGGAKKFFSLGDTMTIATLRDSQTFEFDHAPSRTVGVHFTAVTGATVITPAALAATLAALRPDFAFSLADETTAHVSKRRAENSANRTGRWTAELLEEFGQLRGAAAAPAAAAAAAADADGAPSPKRARCGTAGVGRTAAVAEALPGCALVGAVPGHAIPHRGRAVAAEVAKHDDHFAGYYIAGRGLGETAEEWRAIVATAKQDLPPGKPRFLCGATTPEDILDQVRQGFDVIESQYALDATEAGHALSFSWPRAPHSGAASATAATAAAAAEQSARADAGAPPAAVAAAGAPLRGRVDLNAKLHKLGAGPLVEGCTCMACKKHSRAFVHHLLETKEMLGWTLLEVHNTHHMQAFMAAMHAALAAQSLDAFGRGLQMSARKSVVACASSEQAAAEADQAVSTAVTSSDSDPLNAGPCGNILLGTCWAQQAVFAAIVAVAVAAVVYVAQADHAVQSSFVLGCCLALLWEALLSAPGWRTDPGRLLRLLRPQAAAFLMVWCAWDGIIFLIGEWLSCQAAGAAAPGLVADLAVQVAWGQGSSLAVEATAALLGLWAYDPCGWNVSIARLPNGKHLTLLPQAIWLAASTAFVAISHLR